MVGKLWDFFLQFIFKKIFHWHTSYAINCPQKVIVLIFQLALLFSTNFLLFSTNYLLFSTIFSSPLNLVFFGSKWTNNISEHIYFHENNQDQDLGHFSQSWVKPGLFQLRSVFIWKLSRSVPWTCCFHSWMKPGLNQCLEI